MKIGIIGAGKVGTTLGKYLTLQGKEVSGYYSRTKESADIAATFTETESFSGLTELVQVSDVLFITTPDGVIGEVWKQLQAHDISGSVICHFSGALSSSVFSHIEETGADGLSIHPMYAFSDKFHSYQNFQTAYLTMEGSKGAVSVMKPFWEGMGHRVLELRAEDKTKYHAAAVLASNAMIGLMQAGIDLLGECGFDGEDAMALLSPLVRGNVAAMLEQGCEAALTGPVERCDVQTVRNHLRALRGNRAYDIYASLGKKLTEVAEKKHPEQDYSEMKQLFGP